MREEQHRLRPDLDAPLTGDLLNEMHYTRQVVKEVLRFRPPAPMVPQYAQVGHTTVCGACTPSCCWLHGLAVIGRRRFNMCVTPLVLIYGCLRHAQADFKLTDDYTAPKGSMIVPSVWSACMQVGSRGEVWVACTCMAELGVWGGRQL